MKKYLFGTLFLIVVLAGTSFAQERRQDFGVTAEANIKNIYLDNNGSGNGTIENPYGKFSEIPWSSIRSWVAAGYSVNINLKRGRTWNEQLEVEASGTATHRVTVKPYGAGTDYPVVNGGSSSSSIFVYGKSYITIDGIKIEKSTDSPMKFTGGGTGNILQNCFLYNGTKSNMYTSGQIDLIVRNNRSDASGGHGFYIGGALIRGQTNKDIIIEYNEITNWGWNSNGHGIQFNHNSETRMDGGIIRYNEIHNGENSALNLLGVKDLEIYGNRIDSDERGIVLSWENYPNGSAYRYSSINNKIHNNTIRMPAGRSAIEVRPYCTGNIIENNIIQRF